MIWGLMYLTGGHVVKTNDFNDILACGSYTGIGGGLYFGDYTYEVDFSGLADLSSSLGNGILPDNYRTSGPTTIMGVIQDLCDAASADFFIELQDDLYTISVKTINRTSQPQLGTIESYVQYGKSLNTVASCQVGEAWANNTMGKMVVGDSQTRMIQETAAQQIYGFQNVPGASSKAAKQPILAGGVQQYPQIGSFPKFYVQIPQSIYFPHGSFYIADELEMRFAATSKDAWEKFITMFWPNKLPSPIKKPAALNPNLIVNGENPPPVAANGGGDKDAARQAGKVNAGEAGGIQKQIDIIYSAVAQVYKSFYGQKWLVPIPFFQTKFEDGEIVQEWEVTAAAYDFNNNIVQNFTNPTDANFYDNSGLKSGYLTYAYNPGVLDYRGVQQDSWAVEGNTVYVKSGINDKVIWYGGMPHVAVTSPQVKYAKGGFRQNRNHGDFDGLIAALVLNQKAGNGKKDFAQGPGGTQFRAALSPAAVRPVYFSIPQRSNRHVYGPWIAVGGVGKAQFESDNTLAPQNFGNPNTMAIFGAAKAEAGISYMDTDENGSVEIVGLPSYNLGTTLVANGPYISDINVSVGSDKITTRYAFKTWDVDFGKLTSFMKSSVVKNVKDGIKSAKNFRSLFTAQNLGGAMNNLRLDMVDEWLKGDKKTKPQTPHWFLSGKVTSYEGATYPYVVTESPDDNTVWRGVDTQWANSACASLDVIFAPYGNKGAAGANMPSMPSDGDTDKLKKGGPEGLSSGSLDPFLADGSDLSHSNSKHGLGAALVGGSHDAMPANLSFVVVGWGYDVAGIPTPSSNGKDFIDDVKQNYSQWKAGPIDLAWDDNRKIWTSPPLMTKAKMKVDMAANCDTSGGSKTGNQAVEAIRQDRPNWSEADNKITLTNVLNLSAKKDDVVLVYYNPHFQEWWPINVLHSVHEIVCDVVCSGDSIVTHTKKLSLPNPTTEDFCGDCKDRGTGGGSSSSQYGGST